MWFGLWGGGDISTDFSVVWLSDSIWWWVRHVKKKGNVRQGNGVVLVVEKLILVVGQPREKGDEFFWEDLDWSSFLGWVDSFSPLFSFLFL